MFKNYIIIAWRTLKRNKVYATVNVMGLALGISCSLLIFCLVKYHLAFDDFHENADRIYRFVTEQHRDNVDYQPSVPNPLGKRFREEYTFGEKVARIATFGDEIIAVGNADSSRKFKETIAFVEPEYFHIFNFPLISGNPKTMLTDVNTAIITESLAKKYFGSRNPIGEIFQINSRVDIKITGVLKDLPENTDQKTGVYVSFPTLQEYNEWFINDDTWGGISDAMQTFVLLRPGVSPAQVETVLPAYVKRYRANSKNLHQYKLQPLNDIHYNALYGGAMSKRNIWVLALIGVFLLVTACFNFINLATAQALNRSKEVGVRKVLGGVKKQLFWQFIIETGVITLLSASLALILSVFLLPFINELFASDITIHFLADFSMLLFLPGLVLLVTLFAGSYPGLIMAGFKPVMALKGKIVPAHSGGFHIRRSLIIIQFAIAQVLMISVIVIMSQMQYAKQSDLGFTKEAVVMIPLASGSTGTATHTFKHELLKLAGVENVSLCFSAPSSTDNWNTNIRYADRIEEENFKVSHKAADANYLSTFGLRLVAGRNIFPSDSVREFLVNEAFARKLNVQSPEELLGKKIVLGNGMMEASIVGVVKDFHDRSMLEDINAICITSYTENYSNIAVKINPAQLSATLASLEKLYRKLYPDPIYEYHFVDEDIASFYETEEAMLKLIQVFSLIAIFIGCLGLYGLVSFMVVQKNKEIGIRKVLGGSVQHILWLFSKEFAILIGISFLLASPIAWLLMNSWLQDFKFRIEIGPWIFAISMLLVLLIAAMTVGYQALKAATANPIKSLRTE